MKKKLMSILLAAVMMLCMAPTVAFADGGTGDNTGSASTNKTIMLGTSGIAVNDTVYYGVYNTNDTNYNVPWYVLELKKTGEGEATTKTGFMLSKYTLGTSQFVDPKNWGYYNGSKLRTVMNGLYGGDTSLFTIAEKGAINATKLEKSSMYSDALEITDAHLFPLSYQEALGRGSILYAEDISAPDGSTGTWWLRSSYDHDNACRVNGSGNIFYDRVRNSYGVRPAFNLDLGSVFLASASGTSKSSAIVSDSAQIGAATGSEWKLTLKDDRKTVKLTDNQVVSMAADGTITVPYTYTDTATDAAETVNQISVMITKKAYTESNAEILYYGALQGTLSASGTGTFVLPSALQGQKLGTDYYMYILAEHTTNTNTTDYASTPAEITNVSITGASITGIDTPAATQALDTSAVCATAGVSASDLTVTWTPTATTAGYNTAYTASVTLIPSTGYAFTANAAVTVNGIAATVTKNQDGTLTVTYAFGKTKDKLISITAPQPITVANGTAYTDMNLPTQVSIVTEGSTVTTAAVTWNTQTPASGSYDPTKLEEQSITLNGTVTCPDTVDSNIVPLATTITININKAGTTGVPTCSPVVGTYTENQTVTLTSATEGATIYYTTDGSDPSIDEEGNLIGTTKIYSEPISVTGEQGLSVSTIIKAFAAKEGMFDSDVLTFDYTIKIPHVHGFEGAEWTYNSTDHWHVCTVVNCDASEGYIANKEEHGFTYSYVWSEDNSSCTATRVCGTCGYTDFETAEAVASVTQEKTCTLPELTKYVVTFVNAENNGFEEQIKADIKTAEPTGHTSSDWIVDKAATVEEAGSRHKECTVCGTVLEEEEIAKLTPTPTEKPESKEQTTDKTTSPQTGDASNMVLWFTIIGLSIGGVLISQKKRNVK